MEEEKLRLVGGLVAAKVRKAILVAKKVEFSDDFYSAKEDRSCHLGRTRDD